jgi:hypothetical protein
MEKTIVFLPLIIFGVFFLLLILGFFGLIAKLLKNAKSDEWTGVVLSKGHNTVTDDNDRESEYYFLTIKTDAGKTRNISVAVPEYNSANVGDRYQKIKGKYHPEKI